MTSTFFGINVALRALNAQSRAINTTAHNVANANTEGFTRQTAEMSASEPFTVPAMNREVAAGQLGTGVDVTAILRIRDAFMDTQVREQLASLGTAETTENYLGQIESLVNEPSDSGINSLLNKMFAAWYDLSNSPDSYVAKAAVVQTASVLADAVRRAASQLSAMGTSADAEVDADLADVNSSLKEIDDLNRQIVMVKASGDQPNDLMDRRDLLLDQIAEKIPIGYREESNGAYTVWIGKQSSPPASPPSGSVPPIVVDGTPGATGYVSLHRVSDHIESMVEAGGITASTDAVPDGSKGVVRALLDLKHEQLDSTNNVDKGVAWRLEQMAVALRDQVNAASGQTFFDTTGPAGQVAQTLKVSSAFVTDPGQLDAGDVNADGDGTLALAVAHLGQTPGGLIDGQSVTVNGWYQKLIAQLGIDSKEAQALSANQRLLVDHVKTNRESQSGVSLDEEAANMIRFERAYQAAARVMTVMDEMLDRIINGTGRVGL